MISLNINIVEKHYANSKGSVLSNFLLAVEEGELTSIVGPSGAGKTSLLNIIAGLDEDFKGNVLFKNRFVSTCKASKQAYLFQEPRLMPWLNVEDNISLVVSDKKQQADVDELIYSLELDSFRKAFPKELSGGMQRRVALARAFAIKPSLLLMDEPFVSLDLPGANRLRQYLLKIWKKNRPTVLLVTHDLREALSISDRILFLAKRPAHIIKDFRLDTKQKYHDYNSDCIQGLYRSLLSEHVGLLHGLAAKEDQN